MCNSFGYNSACAVFCETGTDFVFKPAWLYLCSNAEWTTWPYGSLLPDSLPDCSRKNSKTPNGMECIISYLALGSVKEKSAYESSGPSGRRLFQFL